MSETEYPTTSIRFIRRILDPIAMFLHDKSISIVLIPLAIFSVYAFFLFRKRPKGKKPTAEEILVIIGWLFCFVLAIVDQYYMLKTIGNGIR